MNPMQEPDSEPRNGSSDWGNLTPGAIEQMARFCATHMTQVLTILMSDLEGSTRQQDELGNQTAARLVQLHRAIFRKKLDEFQGEEIDTAGDSFLTVFAAPSKAVKFALEMQAAMREAQITEPDLPRVRVGIHLGEVVVEEAGPEGSKAKDIYGLQVSTTARIMDLGQGGQILCSREVFENARANLKGIGPIAWMNHGPYQFKGVNEPYDVCEVGEENLAPLSPPPPGTKSWPVPPHGTFFPKAIAAGFLVVALLAGLFIWKSDFFKLRPELWVKLEDLAEHAPQPVELTTNKAQYRLGESIVITCTPKTSGFLYIFTLSEGEDELTPLYPLSDQEDNHVEAQTTVTIPPQNSPLKLGASEPLGETLVVALITERKTNLEVTPEGEIQEAPQTTYKGLTLQQKTFQGPYGAGKAVFAVTK